MLGHHARDRTAAPAASTGNQLRDPAQQTADVALRRTNKFLEEGIAQTHQLLSLLHQRAATAPSVAAPATAAAAAAAVGGEQAHEAQRPPQRPAASDMDIILLTTQLLCSWQAASTAVQSVPAYPVANPAAEPTSPTCQRQDCQDQAGKLRIRLAAALSEVSMLRGQMSQPFALPNPKIPAQERQQPSSGVGAILSQQSRMPPSSLLPSFPPFAPASRPHSVHEELSPPARKRRRSSSALSAQPENPTTSSKIPAPRKRHDFAGRLATAARSYHHSRYNNGRLALTTAPTTVLAHHLVPMRKLSQSTIQDYITAIISSKGSTSELMNTVLAAIVTSDPTNPLTIGELHARHPPTESGVSVWTQYTLRWSVRPMVAVKVLDTNLTEFAPHWRALLNSLSPAETQYIDGKNPQMVLMVGVDWIGYPLGMFADSPALDVQTTSVGLCERYGLVVGELGVVPDVAISLQASPPLPPRRPATALVSATPALQSFAASSTFSAASGHGRSASSSSRPSGRGFTTSDMGASMAWSAARTASSSDSDDPLPPDGLADTKDDDNDSDSDSDNPHALIPRHHHRTMTTHAPPHTPATQPNESHQIATPASLLTFRKLECRIGRYVNGQPRVRGGRTALANELIPPRAWTAEQVQTNLVAINASPTSTSISRRVLAYAFARGPCAPFSLAELVADRAGVAAQRPILVQRKLQPAVNAALVGHVQVLERLEAAGDVWERLVAAAVASGAAHAVVARRAELVVVAGVEMVGFEAPRAEDVLPEWAERRFVVRERYAIVV